MPMTEPTELITAGEDTPPESPGARRSRELRRRRAMGLRIASAELSERQIGNLVALGLLSADEIEDAAAIGAALVTHAFAGTPATPLPNGWVEQAVRLSPDGIDVLVDAGFLQRELADSPRAVGVAILDMLGSFAPSPKRRHELPSIQALARNAAPGMGGFSEPTSTDPRDALRGSPDPSLRRLAEAEAVAKATSAARAYHHDPRPVFERLEARVTAGHTRIGYGVPPAGGVSKVAATIVPPRDKP